ncbi:radical SAM protein [bacterium]|nr:radical SAM protein [bacterium]
MNRLNFNNAVKTGIQLLLKGDYLLTFDQLEFQLRAMSLRKRLNLFIQAVQSIKRLVVRIGVPPILQIEPTNICNLHCLTCATGAGIMKRPQTLMPFGMYRNIIDQVKDYACFVALWSWGEPFINKDVFRMIRYAKDNGLLVHTSTNGHFFDNREYAAQVIDSGLDSLIVAVDGLDQTIYQKYRKGGNFDLVVKSIKNLIAERESKGKKHPLIILRFIVMKHNEHQIGQVKEFARRLGVDLVTFRSAVVQRDKLNVEEDITPTLEKFQQYSYKGLPTKKHRIQKNGFYCHRPYANLTIFSNGDVVSCENDFNATCILGNVKNQRLRDMISSAKAKSFLKLFRDNIDQISFCSECENRNIKYKTANVETYVLNKEL